MRTSKPQIPTLTLYSPTSSRAPLSSRDPYHLNHFSSYSPDSLRLKSKDTTAHSPNSIHALRVPSSQIPLRPAPPQQLLQQTQQSFFLKNIPQAQSPLLKLGQPGLPLISNSPKSLFNIPVSPKSIQDRGVRSLNLDFLQSGTVVIKSMNTLGQLSERTTADTSRPSIQGKIMKKGSITSRKSTRKDSTKWPIKTLAASPPSNNKHQGPIYRNVYKAVSLQSVESKKRAVLVKQRTQPVIVETPSESSDGSETGDYDIWGKKGRVLGIRDVSEDWLDGRGSLSQGKKQKEFRTIIKNTKSGEQSPNVIIKKMGSKVTFKTEPM